MNKYGENLYLDLCQVVKNNPEKFFMNEISYKGKTLIMFDYSLVIPSDFAYKNALEARGSVFLVDENKKYIDIVCLPYEKFFNLHEFSYSCSDALQTTFKERYGIVPHEDIVSELINKGIKPIFMDKRDGSIISFFSWFGEMDAKSNSSLTSDYKEEALQIVNNDSTLYKKINDVCNQGHTVITEYTSDNPERQIVIPYNKKEIIVTGVRSHSDGKYWTYNEVLDYFGEEYTVDTVSFVDVNDYEKENIEGYIISFEDFGIRFKLKTQWYLERHKIKSSITPRMVWEYYINENIDDIVGSVPITQKEMFEHYVSVCDRLMSQIVADAESFYDENKNLPAKDYFILLNKGEKEFWKTLAALFYRKSYHDALDNFKSKLITKSAMSELGIYHDSPLFKI